MLGRYMIEQLNELRLKNVQCDLELVSSDNRTFNMHQIVFTALNQKHFHLAVQQACIYSSDIILSKKKMYLSQLSSSELEMLIEFMYGATFTTKRTYDILLSALGKLDMLYLLDMIGGFTLDNDSPIKTETSTNMNISNETIDQATQATSIQPRNELGTNTEPVDNIFTNIHVESNDLTSDVGSIKEEPVSPVSTPVIVTVSKPSTTPPCNHETDEPRHEELRSIRKDLFSVSDAVNDSMLQELKTEIETDKEIVGVDIDEIERVYQNFKQSVMSEKLNGTKHSFTDLNPTEETPAVPGVSVTNTSNENEVIDVQLDPTTKSSTICCISTVQYPPKDLCVKDSCQKQLDVHNNDNNDASLLSKTFTVPPHCTSPTVKSPTVKSPTVKSSIQSTAVPHTYIPPKRSVLLINSCAPSLSAGDACTTSNTLSSQASSSITQHKLPTVVKEATTGKSNKNLRSSMGKHDKVFLPNNGVVDQSQVSRNKATPIACSIISLSKVSCAPSNCASFSRTRTRRTSVSVTNQQIFAPKIFAVNSQSSSQVLQQSISLRRSDGATTSEDIKKMVSGRQNFQNTDSMTTKYMVDTKIGDPKPKIQQKSKLMKRKTTSKQVKAKKQAHERYGTQRNLTMTENQSANDINKFEVIVNYPVYGDPSSLVTPAGSETETGNEYDNDTLQIDTEQSSSDVPNQPEFTINENQCANDMSDGATPENAQSSFEFSHKTFQTEGGNTIIQAEISNETTPSETGKKTNQSEFGNEIILPNTGNETIQSETDNETIRSETGNETILSETGNEIIQSETGNETNQSETDNETILTETGNETNLSETGDETIQSETGNETILSKTGNETNLSETGNKTNLSETGNETNQSETGNEIIQSETGNETNQAETGNETNQAETGNETILTETGNETNLSETDDETNLSETGNKTNLSETGDETNLSETGNKTNLSETDDETILLETDKGFVFEQIVLANPNGTIEPIVTTSIITQCTSSICTSSITSSSTSLTTGQYMTLRSKQSPKVHENSLISDERGTHSSKLDTSMCKVVLHDCYKQSIVSAKETPVCNNSYFGKKDKIKKQLRKPLFKKSSKQNVRSKAVSDEHNAKCKNTVYSQMKDLDFIKIDGTLPTNLAECDVLTENATAFLKEPIQNVATSSNSLVYSQSNKQVINFGDVGSVDNIVKDKLMERVNSCENAEKSKVVASFRKRMPSTEYGNFSVSGFTDQRVENEFIVLDEVSNLPVDYTSLNNSLSNEKTPSKSSSDSCIVPLSEILSLTPAQLVKNYQTIVEKSKQKNETIKLPRSGEKGASKSPAFKTFDRTFRRTKSKSDIFEKSSDCQLFKNDQTMIEKSRKRKSISPIEDIENDIIVSAGNMKSVKADGQKNPKRGNSEPGTDRQLVKKYKTLAEILGKTTTNVNHVECTAGCQNRNIEKSSSVSTVITQAVYSGNSKYVNVTLNSTCTVSSAISRMPPVNVSPGQNVAGRQAPSPVAQSKVLFPKVPATVIRFPVRILGHTFQSAKPVVQHEQSTITFSSTSPICSYTIISKSCAEQTNHSRKRWKSTPALSTKEGKKRKLLNCNEKGDFHLLVVDSNPDKSVALENCTGTADENTHVNYNQDVQEIIVDIVENSEEVDIKRNVDPPSSHLHVALFAETESNHGEHGIKQTQRNVRQLNEVKNSNSVEPDEGDSVLVISTDDHMTGDVSDESVDDKPVRNKINKAQFAENTLDTNLTGGNKDGISSKVSFKAPSLKSRRTYLSELRKQDALQRARRSQLARKKGTGNSKQPTKKVPSLKAKYQANDLDFTSKSSDHVPTVIIAPCATNEHTLDSCFAAYKIETLKCAISTSPCIKPLEEVSPVLESPCLLSEQRSAIASTSSSVSTYSTSISCVNYPTSSIPATLSTMSPCSSYTSPIFTQLLTRSQSVGSSSDTIELMSTSEGKSSTVTPRTMSSQSAVALIKSPTPVLSSLLACSAATPMSDTVKSAKPKLVGINKKKNPAEKLKDGVKKKRVRVSKKRKVELTPTLPAVNVLRPIISSSNSILPAFNGLGVINAIRSSLPVSLNSSNSPYRQILPKPPFVSVVIRPKIDTVN